ncbi:DNA alkylation repair protein [Shewanella maritima]|uniref:DNA alkylation repair protein n=1 Tax=Shewanella maritima TaxID=2520507 RepID=UPI003735D72C
MNKTDAKPFEMLSDEQTSVVKTIEVHISNVDLVTCSDWINQQMLMLRSDSKALSQQRFFPDYIHNAGLNSADIKHIITQFYCQFPELSPEDTLAVTEYVLAHAQYTEHQLIAFGLINKYVKRHYDDGLFFRFEYWLCNYANNWAHVDDLCIKTTYQFFLSRPHFIPKVSRWAHSDVNWCRRASNVALVKFIKRKMGKSVYYLDPNLILSQCLQLRDDSDEMVQKSIGWLLKVTSVHHPQAVITYLTEQHQYIPRTTFRYAIEKFDTATKQQLMAL